MFNPYLIPCLPLSSSPKPLSFPQFLRRFTLSESDCSFSFLSIFRSTRNDFLFSSLYRFQGSLLSFRSAVFAVLATTLMIISNPRIFVNPFFASFPTHNFSCFFASFFDNFPEHCIFKTVESCGNRPCSAITDSKRPYYYYFATDIAISPFIF